MQENRIRLEYRKIDELIPYEHNAKLHPIDRWESLTGEKAVKISD